MQQTPLPEFFVESWIYSSCLSVVEQCDSWTSNQSLEGAKLAVYNASKGELLELALNQVRKTRVQCLLDANRP